MDAMCSPDICHVSIKTGKRSCGLCSFVMWKPFVELWMVISHSFSSLQEGG